MKFLLLASYPDSIINFRGNLIDELCRHGFKVHVVAPGLSSNTAVNSELQGRGVVTHDIYLRRTGMNPVSDIRTLVSLLYLLFLIRPDYFLCYTIKPVIYGLIASSILRIKHRYALITGLGYAFQGSGQRGVIGFLVKKLYSYALRNTNKVFFQNPDDEVLFRKLNILHKNTSSFVVNGSGVDTVHFQVVPLPDKIQFLLIARLLGDKGVREYVEAARVIRLNNPEVTFSLVGWIDDNPDAISPHELDKWVEEGVINYVGRLNDVRTAIAASSVYVLPSYREGTPRTVLEAMSMGRAVITTDAPGCRETVNDGDNGFLVPVKSVTGLVNAINNFISNPSIIRMMGQRSREIIEDKYDVNKVNAVMLREMGIS